MDTFIKCQNPDEIRYTLSVTMTIAEWRRFRDHLKSADHNWMSPQADFQRNVTDMIQQIEAVYYPSPENQP